MKQKPESVYAGEMLVLMRSHLYMLHGVSLILSHALGFPMPVVLEPG